MPSSKRWRKIYSEVGLVGTPGSRLLTPPRTRVPSYGGEFDRTPAGTVGGGSERRTTVPARVAEPSKKLEAGDGAGPRGPPTVPPTAPPSEADRFWWRHLPADTLAAFDRRNEERDGSPIVEAWRIGGDEFRVKIYGLADTKMVRGTADLVDLLAYFQGRSPQTHTPVLALHEAGSDAGHNIRVTYAVEARRVKLKDGDLLVVVPGSEAPDTPFIPQVAEYLGRPTTIELVEAGTVSTGSSENQPVARFDLTTAAPRSRPSLGPLKSRISGLVTRARQAPVVSARALDRILAKVTGRAITLAGAVYGLRSELEALQLEVRWETNIGDPRRDAQCDLRVVRVDDCPATSPGQTEPVQPGIGPADDLRSRPGRPQPSKRPGPGRMVAAIRRDEPLG